METTLKILVSMDQLHVDGVLGLVEKINSDHPNLFQRVEVVMKC